MRQLSFSDIERAIAIAELGGDTIGVTLTAKEGRFLLDTITNLKIKLKNKNSEDGTSGAAIIIACLVKMNGGTLRIPRNVISELDMQNTRLIHDMNLENGDEIFYLDSTPKP